VKRRNPEEKAHRTVAEYLDRLGVTWCHVPNGIRASRSQAARHKAMGMKAGVPDFLIFQRPGRKWSGLIAPPGYAIELKAKKAAGHTFDASRRWESSSVTDAQREWFVRLTAAGWTVALCFGVDEALAQLKQWGFK